MGSYSCLLRLPGREEVRYPVDVLRLGHSDGVPPGETEPHPVWLPPEGLYDSDEVYIPAGWFRSGGDPAARDPYPRRRLWSDALVVHRYPVTNQRYLAFLDDLVAQGRESEVIRPGP